MVHFLDVELHMNYTCKKLHLENTDKYLNMSRSSRDRYISQNLVMCLIVSPTIPRAPFSI